MIISSNSPSNNLPVSSISINVTEENTPAPPSLSSDPVQNVQQSSDSPRSLCCSRSDMRDASITSGLVGIAVGSATSLTLGRLAFSGATVAIGGSMAALGGAGLTGLALWGLINCYRSFNSQPQQETRTQLSDLTFERLEVPTVSSYPLPSYEETVVSDFSSQPLSRPPSYDEAIKASAEEQVDAPPPYGQEYSTSFNN